MTTIRINKLDAARRQIETAIELHFENRDQVSVHTLACAGGRIVRDMCEQKKTPMWTTFKQWVRPGKDGEYLALLNRAANFFKHADRDPEEILDHVKEEFNDFTIFLAVLHYVDLGNAATKPMIAFLCWFNVMYPDLIIGGTPVKATLQKIHLSSVKDASRAANSMLGLSLLRQDVNLWLKATDHQYAAERQG
jgi:hypothetical protein